MVAACNLLGRPPHDSALLERLRNWQAGMGRVRKRRAGIGVRHYLRPRHVGNIQNEEPVVPVADIESIAHAQRMVATRRNPIVPWIRLAARFPLTWNPPSSDLHR